MVVKRTNCKNVRKARSVTLALIAMLELLLLCVSLTFSWFDRAPNAPFVGRDISTAPVLYSTVVLDDATDAVNLNQFFEEKGAKAKFSPVYSSDGLTFFYPDANGLKLTSSEIHAAALSFEFTIESAVECDFWFESIPEITVIGAKRGTVQVPSAEEDPSEAPTEEDSTTEPSSEAPTFVEPTEESTVAETTEAVEETTETTSAAEIPTGEPQEESTGSVEGTEGVDSTESVDGTEDENEKPDTRGESIYDDVFYISFHGEECQCGGTVVEPCVAIPLKDANKYLANNAENNVLFSHLPGEKDTSSVIRCSIWYQSNNDDDSLAGAEVQIKVKIASNWGQMRTIELSDDTLTLGEMYPLVGEDGYYVEIVNSATGVAYPAVYDSETGTWIAEVPVSVKEFDVRYRSKSIDREIIATWERIDGREVCSFVLMDDGVYISTE